MQTFHANCSASTVRLSFLYSGYIHVTDNKSLLYFVEVEHQHKTSGEENTLNKIFLTIMDSENKMKIRKKTEEKKSKGKKARKKEIQTLIMIMIIIIIALYHHYSIP